MNSNIYRKIMVATDGSELVKKAVNTAIEIASLAGAKLYDVYVVESGALSRSHSKEAGWDKTMKEHLTAEGKEAATYVETAGKAANVEIESVILEGNPAHEIIEFADKNDIDLIVMGTHGRTGIQRFLMGSVAQNVVRHSGKAVLVVRSTEAE